MFMVITLLQPFEVVKWKLGFVPVDPFSIFPQVVSAESGVSATVLADLSVRNFHHIYATDDTAVGGAHG